MKVIALKQGYFGKLREPGHEFEVPDGTTASWFEPVKQQQKAEAKGGNKPTAPAAEKPAAADLV